ncbi:DUF2332 family protein [Rhizobium sp. KVB221]|uniref:DUF2332 family protein n=1 Tax=Rhizobium setariae TaxID=2801340 RepID=A0A936YT35_9HYPH|nr:DUF2332 family protein [Rhizobium setariae]MBL0372222.1 DUF2332 family protein [Rhizobium setariae]
MSPDTVRQAFIQQAQACEALGSPFTAQLSRLFARRLKPGTAVADRILNWPGDPSPKADSVPLRAAGCLHALVLEGKDAALTAAYPPCLADGDALWQAVAAACISHEGFILERLKSAPQTNEVRRSGALLPGFLSVANLFGKPLVLSEIGASAGLNLQWDRYRYRLDGRQWGDPSSAVSIEPDWHGTRTPEGDTWVAERAGCDLNPIDASNPEHCLRMLSYIWADQADRLARTRSALQLAASHNLRVQKADAIDWLAERLDRPFPGQVHVIFHTIAWQYLPKSSQNRGEALIADAGARATIDAPLGRLSLEADDGHEGAALSLQVWPSGEKQEIGRADFHGRWVRWKGWAT